MYRRVMIAAGLGLAMLAGCGPLNPGAVISTNNFNLRVLNGSPGLASAVDVKLDSSSGAVVASSLAYGSITTYASVGGGAHAVLVFPTGSSTALLSCSIGAPTPGVNYTVVVAGTQSAGATGTTRGLQCQLFAEPIFAAPTSPQANVAFHNASPAAAATNGNGLSFGTFTPGQTNYQVTTATVAFNGPSNGVSSSTASYSTVTGATTAPGVGIWVGPGGSSGAPSVVYQTILPSKAQTGASGLNGTADTSNLFPYSTSTNFSIYAVDAPAGTAAPTGGTSPIALFGAFD